MKRNLDLVRDVLLALEEHPHGYAPSELEIVGYSQEEIGYHVHLMGQAGLLLVDDITGGFASSPQAVPMSITWGGYEFLEAARDLSRWKAALNTIRQKGVALTFEILKGVLVDMSRRALLGP